jgi:hypothetical protein
MATEEMRNDFDEMTALHQRPKDFRLKVRNHHGLMTITSLAKLHFSQNIEISFSGTNPQTYQLLKTKTAIENNFKSLNNLVSVIGFPELKNRKETRGKIRYLFYPNLEIGAICDFIDNFKIEQPSIRNATLCDYIRAQYKNSNISEWNICIVANTDDKVFIDYAGNTPLKERQQKENVNTYDLHYNGESITMGCSVRNQPKITRNSDYYSIAKNQIDDLKDRQIDLSINNLKTNKEIKEQRAKEKKGLLLIYALDERGTPNVNNSIPIIGYSLHFPRIENEVKTSYTTTIYGGFDEDPQEDDDSPNSDNE